MCLLNFAENTYKCIKNSTLKIVEIGESNYPGNRSVHCIYISAFNDFSKHLNHFQILSTLIKWIFLVYPT